MKTAVGFFTIGVALGIFIVVPCPPVTMFQAAGIGGLVMATAGKLMEWYEQR